ncbi:hypothetical protein R6Q57_010086 [Mikania cordata]
MKRKTVKRNSHAGDVDYIPSAEDDSEDDDQQVGGSVVASKKVVKWILKYMMLIKMMDMKTLIVASVDDYTLVHMRHVLKTRAAMMMSQLLADED